MDRIWSGLKVVIKGLFQWPRKLQSLFDGIFTASFYFPFLSQFPVGIEEHEPNDHEYHEDGGAYTGS
jgi:hypothetical protein